VAKRKTAREGRERKRERRRGRKSERKRVRGSQSRGEVLKCLYMYTTCVFNDTTSQLKYTYMSNVVRF